MEELRTEIEHYNGVQLASDSATMTFKGDPNTTRRAVKVFFKSAEDYAYFKRHHFCDNGRIHRVYKYVPRKRPAPSQLQHTNKNRTEQQDEQQLKNLGTTLGVAQGEKSPNPIVKRPLAALHHHLAQYLSMGYKGTSSGGQRHMLPADTLWREGKT
ncbi:hypothetical protein TRVA0_100S00122 [Trichomonascus vanleenenianus]|uniref:uncharacterized protein n=1 Tax=Trichomonascus vanleenenianus TaxID=2268995 RepID=UPI003ECA4442